MVLSPAVMAAVSVIITIVSYLLYLRGMARGKARPHLCSWLLWGLIGGVVAVGQFTKGAGLGALTAGVTCAFCLFIGLLALKYGERNVTPSDKFFTLLALLSIPLWIMTGDPLWSVLLLCTIHMFSFFPTFRKSWHKPHEEVVMTYVLTVIKWLTGLFALQSLNLTTALYPITASLVNASFIAMVLLRRARLL